MLTELGHESSALGVARLYASIASTIIIDNVDAELKDAIEREGVRCIVTNTVMSDQKIAAELALTTLNSVSGQRK
jgi:LPPG:FO 2-phospho-L-lactate transferase